MSTEATTTSYDASGQRVCRYCRRVFLSRDVFARHRPLGKCETDAELRTLGLCPVGIRPLRTSVGTLVRLWVDASVPAPARPSYDAADFDPDAPHPRLEPKRCNRCSRVFSNRWTFLRHRPEGRGAIHEPENPTVPCYSDRHLRERLGMWQANGIWCDDGRTSPLEELPEAEREGHGKGRTFASGNRRGAHAQARRKSERGSQD